MKRLRKILWALVLEVGVGYLCPSQVAAESLSPELVVRRCEVIAIGEIEAVADAWNVIPLSAWYPHMKNPDEYLVLGLAKFRITKCLKGGSQVKSGVIHAAFPVKGYKSGSTKPSGFTMTDFRTLTPRDLGREALWCFQWDDTAGCYVVRFDYQRRSTADEEELADLIHTRAWTFPDRLAPAPVQPGIVEGTVTAIDINAHHLTLSLPGRSVPFTAALPDWLTAAGSDRLTASDLQIGDAVRLIRRAEGASIDELVLIKEAGQALREVYAEDVLAADKPSSPKAKAR